MHRFAKSMRLALVMACLPVALVFSCRESDPCDPGYELVGPSCFPIKMMEAGGSDDGPMGNAGEPSGGAPVGNPDATFGTHCTNPDDSECGGPAPVCADEQIFYCTQINCKDGEENAGVCPMGWTCLQVGDKPSACVNLSQ